MTAHALEKHSDDGARSVSGDMLFGMGSKLLYAGTRVALPPLALSHMGLEDYGLWSTCFVLVSYVGMAASGFSLVYLRSTARLHQRDDRDGLGRLLSTGILSMAGVTAALMTLLVAAMPFLLDLFHVSPAQQPLARDLWLGAVGVFLADMSIGAFANVLHAIGKMRQEQTVWILAFLLEALMILVLLRAGWGVRGLLAAFAIRYVFSASANALIALRALPGLRLHWRQFDRSLLREFFVYGAGMQASGLAGTALGSLDRLLAGTLVGPHATALMDLATKLPGTAASVMSSASSVALSASARHDAGGDTNAVHHVYDNALRVTAGGLALTMPLMLAFAPALSMLWLGPAGPHLKVATLLAFGIPGLHLHMLTGPATALTRGRGKLGPDFVYHGLRALALGIGVGIWWGQGRPGELAGFIITLSVAQSIAAAIFIGHAHWQVSATFRDLWARTVLPTALSYGVALALAQALSSPLDTRAQALVELTIATTTWLALSGLILGWLLTTRYERLKLLGVVVSLAGCSTMNSPPTSGPAVPIKVVDKTLEFTSPETLALLEAPVDMVYRLGAGDAITLQVWGRPELSGRHIVGPDGTITVPIAGPVSVEQLTREEAAQRVRNRLTQFYQEPNVQFGVEQYASYRITVLGRVHNPGTLNYDHVPTLLEVLAKSAALHVGDKQATLARCAIFRGREKILWVDLKRLLHGGDVALNLRMMPGDLLYIPDLSEPMVYVLGSVNRPGAYRLTPRMSLLEALATAGGPHEDGRPQEIGVYRAAQKQVERVTLQTLIDGSQPSNLSLEDGDVIFVPKSGIAEFGYFTRQLAAGLSLMTVISVFGK